MPRSRSGSPATARPRVIVVRGHQANPWELRPWEHPALAERFDVCYLRSRRGWFDTGSLTLPHRTVWTRRDLLPPGRLGDLAARLPGDRYLGLRGALRGADVVHSQELGYWYSMQAAKLKQALGFRLVLTVWETIPLLDAYRNVRTRPYRAQVLANTDLFLATTERARSSLLLEGAPAERIRVCPPGVDTDRFGARAERPSTGPPMILSPGRLVWEKGHQDVLRALALVRRGLGSQPATQARLVILGSGPDEHRLRAYARELGVADAVEFRGFIAYDDMPRVYAEATCVVLASLPTWSWEEQFGMVLAEAMAAEVPILASSSGAIPEVAGSSARYFSPGDWPTLAEQLAEQLDRTSQERVRSTQAQAQVDERGASPYSTEAAAARLASAYEAVLADTGARAPSSRS